MLNVVLRVDAVPGIAVDITPATNMQLIAKKLQPATAAVPVSTLAAKLELTKSNEVRSPNRV